MIGLRHMWFIAVKDLRSFFTDRLALFFFILFPFMFVVMFNFLLQGGGSTDARIQLYVAAQEQQGLSQQIIQAIETKDESALKPGEPKIIWARDYAAARQSVDNKTMSGFLSFPADFTASIMQGSATQLEVITTPDSANTRAALDGLAQALALRIDAQQATIHSTIDLMAQQGLVNSSNITGVTQALLEQSFNRQASNPPIPPIRFVIQKVGDIKATSPSNYVIPGYLVMFVFFAAALGAENIVRERQNNTLERLLTTSVKRSSILGGQYIGTAARGLVQIIIFWTVGMLAFKLDFGVAPAAVILLSILFVLMSAAFSIMLATLVRTERAAGSIGVLTSLVLAPLGGCWWPLFITPPWMQFLAKLTPHGWANTGFNKLMVFGGDFGSVAIEMLVLVGFAVIFAAIAARRFRTGAL